MGKKLHADCPILFQLRVKKMGMGLEQHESESIITWFSQVNCFLLVA